MITQEPGIPFFTKQFMKPEARSCKDIQPPTVPRCFQYGLFVGCIPPAKVAAWTHGQAFLDRSLVVIAKDVLLTSVLPETPRHSWEPTELVQRGGA